MKKFLALMTLVCMVLTATVAFAFPSKTAEDLTVVGATETATGVELADDFALAVAEPTEEIAAEVAAIYTYVAENPIATYLPEETQAAIAELGVDASALVGYEAVAVACDNYKAEYGDVNAEMTFATVFPEGSEVVVLVKTTEWSVQKAVVENGAVKVAFTDEQLAYMNETPALVLVLANEIAE